MILNKETEAIPWGGQSLQQMVLENDVHMEKNKVEPLTHTICRN